jgi:hypothetical protein
LIRRIYKKARILEKRILVRKEGSPGNKEEDLRQVERILAT